MRHTSVSDVRPPCSIRLGWGRASPRRMEAWDSTGQGYPRPLSRWARPEELAGPLTSWCPRAGPTGKVWCEASRRCSGPAMWLAPPPRLRLPAPPRRNDVGTPAEILGAGVRVFVGPGRRPRPRPWLSWPRSAGCGSCSACPEHGPAGGFCGRRSSAANLAEGLVSAGVAVPRHRLEGVCCTPPNDTLFILDRPGRRGWSGCSLFEGAPARSSTPVPAAPGRGGRGAAADRSAGRRLFCVVVILGHDQHRSVDPLAEPWPAAPGPGAGAPRRDPPTRAQRPLDAAAG